jgi:SMI1 / KNR4 family (SUKH-1)
MVVNGFELPRAFVLLCEAIRRGEAPKEWKLKENVDGYGRPWKVADLRVICDTQEIQRETDEEVDGFLHKGRWQHLPEDAEQPSSIACFVFFAHSTDGLVYAFDFGTDGKDPSVVHWYGHWRRVAPNFASFIALFVDADEYWRDRSESEEEDEEDEEDEVDEEESEGTQPSPRNEFAALVPRYVLAFRAEQQAAYLAQLARIYPSLTRKERGQVEAEVREHLDRRGMSDGERRRLDELWERLRASHPS